MNDVQILALAEDPGAANMLFDLPAALAEQGYSVRLFARGPAHDYLADRAIAHEEATADARDLLEGIRPRLVVVGTAEDRGAMGLRLIDLARARGIATVGVVDAPANAAHRFRGMTSDPLTHAPDRLAVSDKLTAQALAGCGFEPANIFCIGGNPYFDWMRRQAEAPAWSDRGSLRHRVFPGLDGDRPIILVASELSTGLDPDQYRRSADYTLHGEGDKDGRTEIVLQEILRAAASRRHEIHLVLRLHPKQPADDLGPLVASFDDVSQGGNALETIYAADGVVGMSSSILTEAALLAKPVLAVLPRSVEREWLPSIATGLIPTALTRRDVETGFAAMLGGARVVRSEFDAFYPPGAAVRLSAFIAETVTAFAQTEETPCRAL